MVAMAMTALAAGCAGEGPAGGALEATAGGDDFVLTGVSGVTQVAKLTGAGAVNDTDAVGVSGTDLGSMLTVGDRTYFFFGDTFADRNPEVDGAQGGFWRSNVVAWSTDEDPSDGVTFDGWVTDELGLAREIAPGRHEADGAGEVTKIPTHAFEVDGSIYAAYMSVDHWGDPGVWTANYAGLVRSDDEGATWTLLDAPTWPGDSGFVQVSALTVREDGEDFVYLWGIPAGRFGEMSLMKVPATRATVEDGAAYRYFAGVDDDGKPVWSAVITDAKVVLEGTVGEFSVMFSDYLDRWVVTYTSGGEAILREGLSPWGPWGEPFVLTDQAETPGLYSPYLNSRYVSHDGRRLFFTLSVWGPYSVYWYRVDLETGDTGPSDPPAEREG